MKAMTTVFRLRPDGDARRDKIHRRNRPPISCLACRARKQKCDRAQPCGACLKRGDDAACSYAPAPPAAAGRLEAQDRLQRLEDMVHRLLARPPVGPATEDAGPAPAPARPPAPPGANTAVDSRASPPPDLVSAADTSAAVLSDKPFAGATSWHAVLDGIRDIQGYLSAEADEAPPPSPSPSTEAALDAAAAADDDDIFFPAATTTGTTTFSAADVLAALPPKPQADALLAACWDTGWTPPILHGPSFRRAYERFYADPAATPLPWAAQLAALLSIGALFRAAGADPPAAALAPRLRALAVRALVSAGYLAAPPGSVEAVLVLCFAHLVVSTAPPPRPANPLLPALL